jgi:SAM-dependent methyltransferase
MYRKIKQKYMNRMVRNKILDDPMTSFCRAQQIQNNTFLKKLYEDWYRSIEAFLPASKGTILEVGSGGGFLRDIIPSIITSEILDVHHVDIQLDARYLPFADASLSGIVMVGVFHHIPDIRRFLKEAARCVKPGGRIIMNEPWVSLWSSFVYKYLHYEPFLIKEDDWRFISSGPLTGANSALPWIVFNRDRQIFEKDFHQWRIHEIILHTPISYLLSGGLAVNSLFSGRLFKFCRSLERLLSPLISFTAMFALIVLERQSDTNDGRN